MRSIRSGFLVQVLSVFGFMASCADPDAAQVDARVDATPVDARVDAVPIDAPDVPTVPALRVPSRDAYVGSIFVPGSLRPRFGWEPSTTTMPATITYELELGTDASFASGVTMMSTTMTTFTPAADLPVSQAVPVGARFYWRVRACAAAGCSAHSSTWWVNVGRSDHDVNSDDLDDVIVAAPFYGSGDPPVGRAYVYFGGAGGAFDAGADGTLTGAAPVDSYGWQWSVASAGDVNGDGFADVIVGRCSNNGSGGTPGRVYVYFGGAGGAFDAVADAMLAGAATYDAFGCSVASAGDVNGDGFADLIVGAPWWSTSGASGEGRAYVYFGGAGAFDTVPDGTLTGAAFNSSLGFSVASAGDVNGDGFADVVVGTGGLAAHVYFGGAGGTFDADADGTLTGAVGEQTDKVASAGDVNGDGFADIVVAGYSAPTAPRHAYVYFGGAGGVFDGGADGTLTGTADEIGSAVASAGDVNGDGFTDVIVGVPYGPVDPVVGRAYVYFGGAGAAFDPVADGTLAGGTFGDEFGLAVAPAGDVNGDGFADVIVGAPSARTGGLRTGQAYVYFGGAGSAFDAAVDGTLAGAEHGDGFGASVASADDLDGDDGPGSMRSCAIAPT